MKKEAKGSALIIAMLLMTAVGSVAFAIGRLFVVEASISTIYENSVVAYYAAESGIEEALLRYRYDKNEQVPDGYNPLDEETNSLISRVNLTTSQINSSIENDTPLDSVNEAYYDLQILSTISRNHGNTLWESDDVSADDPNYIAKDEAVKIDITDLFTSSTDNNIIFSFDPPSLHKHSFIEAKIIKIHGNAWSESKKVLASSHAQTELGLSSGVVSLGYEDQLNWRISDFDKVIVGGDTNIDPNSRVELYLKPVSSRNLGGVMYRITRNASPGFFSVVSPFNEVTSVGHYGGSSRRLVARIDRQAGTLYDLFDYVIYDYGN